MQFTCNVVYSAGKIFVKNLPRGFREKDVYRIFKKCGTVMYIHLFRDKVTKQSKGKMRIYVLDLCAVCY